MATALAYSHFQFSEVSKQFQLTRPSTSSVTQHPTRISTLKSIFAAARRRKRSKRTKSDEDRHSVTQLLRACVESGRLEDALQLFEEMPQLDTFIWNVVIKGLVDDGFYGEVFDVYYSMQVRGIRPDNFTFPLVIKACGGLFGFVKGLKIHANLVKNGLLMDLYVANSLIAMYAKLGCIEMAESVFYEMDVKDLVTWNSIISGCVSVGNGSKALLYFKEMLDFRVLPDRFSIIAALCACSLECSLEKGMEIHSAVLRNGFEMDVMVQTSVVDMFCKCGGVDYAQRFFDFLPQRSLGSWNALIAGYALHDRPYESLACFRNMQEVDKLLPDTITLINVLPACARLEALLLGKTIHGSAIRRGFLPHIVLSTALLDMYGACRRVHLAGLVFHRTDQKNLISWNSMLAVYVQNDCYKEALMFFKEILATDLDPDAITLACVLPAYAELGSPLEVKQIHGYVVKSGLDLNNTRVSNALIYSYAKCGDLCGSGKCFGLTFPKDIVTWNVIIMAYAIHGFGGESLRLFSQMRESGIRPNKSTFASLLSSCSISGLVDEGWKYFNMMKWEYGIDPSIEHYGCMIDLIGRTGNLDMALSFIKEMPLAPTARIWGALLAASRSNRNIEFAERAANHIFPIQHDNTGCYILLANMYAEAGRWADVEHIRNATRREGIQRTTRYTLIEASGKLYKFIDQDRSHCDTNRIYEALDIIGRKIGVDVNVHSLNKFRPNELARIRAKAPEFHSLRLGIAFGLISKTVGSPVLIKSNVRICKDCHEFAKKISEVTQREIIVGDPKIFHHFRHGSCSCGDYW